MSQAAGWLNLEDGWLIKGHNSTQISLHFPLCVCVCVSLLVVNAALLREPEKSETKARDLARAARLWWEGGTSLRGPVQNTYWLDWVLLRPEQNHHEW